MLGEISEYDRWIHTKGEKIFGTSNTYPQTNLVIFKLSLSFIVDQIEEG